MSFFLKLSLSDIKISLQKSVLTVQKICVHSTVAWLCNRCIFGIAGPINSSLVMTPNYNHVADSMYLEMKEMICLNCLSGFTGGTCGIVSF